MTTETDFDKIFDKAYAEHSQNFDDCVNVAIVGKVSAGKSSLLNAILERDRSNMVAVVGAHSGVTTKITPYRLDEKTLIIDCPGLDDVRAENSKETTSFLQSIDLGIFVVTGSADASQNSNFQDLKRCAKHTIFVLNKTDEWDELDESAYLEVVEQWKDAVGVEKIYGTCVKGYDPKFKGGNLVLRGVDQVREEIAAFLALSKKEILWAKNLRNKAPYATKIIAGALASVAVEAFIPGSAAYITGTQIVAISSLHYLYTGKVLDKSTALGLLPAFAGQSIGTTAYVWAKSFLPPTLVLDAAAAAIASCVTFAMLAAVKAILESGHELSDTKMLMAAFKRFRSVGDQIKEIPMSDLKRNGGILNIVQRMLTSN